ncbi:MAG: cell division ATP-binding protein FtsE [Naasia sp.]
MIRFEHVTKLYPGNSKPALNGTDVEIKAGEFVFLVGASGSGKSSFLRLVLKEDKPTSGEIHVLGQRLSSVSSRKIPYFRRSLGVVFQDFRLLPGRTVYQNVAFTLQVIGKSRGFIQEAVPDVLKMVGLEGKAERLPHELSGGEQQRVAIARAVVNKPAILLADEPTGNLDPTTSAGIMQVLELINAGGTTVVMATHDVGIVDSMKRRVIELIGGNIVRDETEGGYTTSIPIQGDQEEIPAGELAGVGRSTYFAATEPATSATAPIAAVTGATAFAKAVAEEIGHVDLPSSPRTVVETTPHVDPDADEPAVPFIPAATPGHDDQQLPAAAHSPAAPVPAPGAAPSSAPAEPLAPSERPAAYRIERRAAFGTPLAYPGAVPTITGVIPRLGDYERQLPVESSAPTPPATAPIRHAQAAPLPPAHPASAAQVARPAPPVDSRPAAPAEQGAPAAPFWAGTPSSETPAGAPERPPLTATGEVRRVRGRHSTGEAPVIPSADDVRHFPPTQPIDIPPRQDPLRHLLTGQVPRVEPAADAQSTEHHDDPLALAVRLGLRREGASPEPTGSQEVGPTS